jgi:ankyrin repeat protein
MFSAVSDALPMDIARDLIERGADLNVKSSRGLTALDFDRRLDATPMVDLLVKAGANEATALADPVLQPKPGGHFSSRHRAEHSASAARRRHFS